MKTILHLCADIGSDSQPYADAGYNVLKVGKDTGVERFFPPLNVHGVIANPVCTNFSIANNSNKYLESDTGFFLTDRWKDALFLVDHCLRIIKACKPKFWVLENPAAGSLNRFLGNPTFQYEPWWYGSPWTKKTSLWGNFNIPKRVYQKWDDVPKNEKLYVRPGRRCSMAWLHKNAVNDIPEFQRFAHLVNDDMSLRSLCSQNFAKAFFEVNQ